MSDRWVFLSMVNLFVVTLLGVTLRYKGAFALPFVDYKNLLNAHSHFAFSGWVTTALFTSLYYILLKSGIKPSPAYRFLFLLNQLASYGMLVSFTLEGYGTVSIIFSALSVVFSYWFAIQYLPDIEKTDWPAALKASIRFAVSFLVLSSVGPFLLASGMHHAGNTMAFYYNAIYLYLHFQYNGWFTFAVIALFLWSHHRNGIAFSGTFVLLLGIACVPAYCLSVLWMDPPAWVWAVAAGAAMLQVTALVVLLRRLGRSRARPLVVLSIVAFVLKVVLQALSVIPSLGKIAFSFRPIVIAYLHLVLLGFVTLGILAFLISEKLIHCRSHIPLWLFVGGVVANEVFLLLQSLLALFGHSWTNARYYLLGAALLMSVGAALLLAGQSRNRFKRPGRILARPA